MNSLIQHTTKRAFHRANNSQFDFSKAFVLNKITRYEFEKKKYRNCSDAQLKVELTKRGSNFERLIEHHSIHYRSLERVLSALKERNIEYRVAQRHSLSDEDVEWAKWLVTAGGDGTFLLAAGKVNSNCKPVVGVNTDVTGSEGHLLLPKQQSLNFNGTLEKILGGDFEWLMRARIRIFLEGDNLNFEPIELHDQVLNNLENRYIDHYEENRNIILETSELESSNKKKEINNKDNKQKGTTTNASIAPGDGKGMMYQVPTLALNEVFIGESLSARVSYYQMSVDNGKSFKQKSSGIIVCTGTGSTSWCYNINKMSTNSIKKLLQLIKTEIIPEKDESFRKYIAENKKFDDDDNFVQKITNKFNDSIMFEPSRAMMAYTIRDPIINRIFQNETNRGFGSKIVVQSRCFDAVLVIDGGRSYQFNDGAKAILQTLPEDSLKTIVINED